VVFLSFNFEKNFVIMFFVCIVFAGFVFGVSNPGHSISAIDPPIGCEANQFLKLDSSGTVWECETGTGGTSQWITSGTSIYYGKGNVGIGTTSPTASLHVLDSAVSSTYQWASIGNMAGEIIGVNNKLYILNGAEHYLLSYDGSTWADFGKRANAIGTWNNQPCIAIPYANIECYNGSDWISIAPAPPGLWTGSNTFIQRPFAWNNQLCVVTMKNGRDIFSAMVVRCYNGSSWNIAIDLSSFIPQINPNQSDFFTVWNSAFCTAGDSFDEIYCSNGATPQKLPSPNFNQYVKSLAVWNGQLCAVGNNSYSAPACYNGNSWESLGFPFGNYYHVIVWDNKLCAITVTGATYCYNGTSVDSIGGGWGVQNQASTVWNNNLCQAHTSPQAGSNVFCYLPNVAGIMAVFENNAVGGGGKIVLTRTGRLGVMNPDPSYGIDVCTVAGGGYGCEIRAVDFLKHSDLREKANIKELDGALGIVNNLRSVYFNWKKSKISSDGTIFFSNEVFPEQDIGLIAQEVYNVFPVAVEKPVNEQNQTWSLSYEKFVPLLIKSVQELSAENKSLKQRVSVLEEKCKKN
jgi:hypothetical protein